MKKYIDKDKEKSFITLPSDENISVEEINDNDEYYSIEEEEKEETSNNDNTTNNSNISNNGNSSNNSGSSSNTKPTQPTKPSSVQPTIENVKSKVASLGWTYNKEDYEQYKCYKDEVSMGGWLAVNKILKNFIKT